MPHCCCSVAKSCLTLCDPMDCSMPGFPVPHHLPEFVQVHVHCIGDAAQPSYPLSPPSSCLLFLSGAKAFCFLLSTAPIFKLELNDKSLIYLQVTSYKSIKKLGFL